MSYVTRRPSSHSHYAGKGVPYSTRSARHARGAFFAQAHTDAYATFARVSMQTETRTPDYTFYVYPFHAGSAYKGLHQFHHHMSQV
jgi:hypothetical protein